MSTVEQQTYTAKTRIADRTTATTCTAWDTEHDNASNAELTSLPATPCTAAECRVCTAKRPRWAVLPYDSGLRSGAVKGGAEAEAATSANTAPAAPAQRRRHLTQALPRPAATKAPAALESLDYIVVDLAVLPKVDRPFAPPPRSVLATVVAAIDTQVSGYTPSPIFDFYGRAGGSGDFW